MKEFGRLIAIGALFVAVIFGLSYLGYLGSMFFAPRYEAIRRDVMIESRAYSESSVRELYRLREQYINASSDDARSALRSMTLHEFSIFPRDRLPPDLQTFYATLQHN